MAHANAQSSHHEVLRTQEIALHMIASAARVLLMIGTAVLVGEVAAGPTRRLIAARRHHHDQPVTPEASGAGEA
jgi:CO dehydrogenase/acetyl-CoA synthase epsilon subunit